MLQSKQRLLQLNAKLAETLTSKGVTATADETTTALVNKVADITSGDDSVLRGLIQRDLTEITIPEGITEIGANAFNSCRYLQSVKFNGTETAVSTSAFNNCVSLKELILPNTVSNIGTWAFQGCSNLEKIYIPKLNTHAIGPYHFNGCNKLQYVVLQNGFSCSNLDLSASTLYTRETILQWLNALADRTGQTAYKLTIGATNLAKLTEQDILIATNKNWTLA